MRRVILYPGEDGYWVAECPNLPGCVSQGATQEEALANIKEAVELWIESALADGDPIPPDTGLLTLEELLSGITEFNIHPEIDWGRSVGKEAW